MSETYPGTNVPFERYALPDLHDPIVLGPGSDSLQNTSQVYSSLAETLDKAVGDLRAVLAKSQHAQQGQAADAARQHVLKVVSAGEAGAEHARLATYALQEQAAYFARARTDMQAAADTAASGPGLPANGRKAPSPAALAAAPDAGHTVAVEGAHLYQNNSNHNLTFLFQGFDPPQIAAPDVSAGPQPQAPGWGGATLGSGAHGVTPAGTGGGIGSTAAGVGPGGFTPVAPSAGGAAGSATAPPMVDAPAAPGTTGSTPLPVPRGTGGRVGGATAPGSTVKPGRVIPTPGAAAPSLPGGGTAGRTLPAAPGAGGSLPGSGLPNPGDAEAGRSGWGPGQPWTSRSGTSLPGSLLRGTGTGDASGRPPAGGSVAEPRSVSGRPSTPGMAEPSSSAADPSSRATNGHAPFMPMGGAGSRGQETEHRRPSWLVENDPEALWMSGLPEHGPAVIEPLED